MFLIYWRLHIKYNIHIYLFPFRSNIFHLQAINNSDLEYIKELGSGTYGTVFYGKWKGSDVAIKKLKVSCCTEGSVEEERLVIIQTFLNLTLNPCASLFYLHFDRSIVLNS